jgi:hypothetical protein
VKKLTLARSERFFHGMKKLTFPTGTIFSWNEKIEMFFNVIGR